MKKTLSLMLITLLIGITLPASRPAVAAGTRRAATFKTAPLPDLVLVWTLVPQETKEQLQAGKFEIRIKNQGGANAGDSYVQVIVTHYEKAGSNPQTKSFYAKVPAIRAGRTADVVVETGLDLTLDSACTIVDTRNQITESDETNNKLCSEVDT